MGKNLNQLVDELNKSLGSVGLDSVGCYFHPGMNFYGVALCVGYDNPKKNLARRVAGFIEDKLKNNYLGRADLEFEIIQLGHDKAVVDAFALSVKPLGNPKPSELKELLARIAIDIKKQVDEFEMRFKKKKK